MAKLDGDRYPTSLTAEGAAEIADVLVNEFGGDVQSEEAFAQELGHSTSNSGAFIKKIADARSYGVLPSRGLKATSLAQRIANPKDEQERREAMFEMYENVPILAKLYDRLDGREPPNQLWSVLVEITDAERNEAKEAEDDIRELYENMLEYELSSESSEPSTEAEPRSSTETTSSSGASGSAPSSPIYLKIGDDEHKFGELNELNVEILQKILESKKQTLSVEADNPEPSEDENAGPSIQDFS